MDEFSKEPVIGQDTGVNFSKLPDAVQAPSPLERARVGVHKTIGGENVIDASGNTAIHPSEKPQTMLEILHSLEDVVDLERREELDKIAANYIKHPEDYRGVSGLLKAVKDPTEREYLAAIIARYEALEASSEKGGAVENIVGLKKFEKLKRLAFGNAQSSPQPA